MPFRGCLEGRGVEDIFFPLGGLSLRFVSACCFLNVKRVNSAPDCGLQSFNTTTSMGRLTLNVLLSFAQFEREVTAERIRDKFRASRAKGMYMGGVPPLGYDVKARKLVINKSGAAKIQYIFERFREIGSGKSELSRIDSLQFIFTAPTFTPNGATDRLTKERREFFIPKARREGSTLVVVFNALRLLSYRE